MSEIKDLIRATSGQATDEEVRRITRRITTVYVVVEEDDDYRERVLVATRNLGSAWQAYRRAVNEELRGVTVRVEAWVEHAERAEVLVWHRSEGHVTTSELRQLARRRRRDEARHRRESERAHREIDQLGAVIASMPEGYRPGSVIASMPEWFERYSTPF